MSDSTSTLVKDFEELVRKTAEANKVFISEGSKFVKRLGSSPISKKGVAGIPPHLLKDAFNSFVKLNMQHANNLIDLGLTLTKRFNGSPETTAEPFEEPVAGAELARRIGPERMQRGVPRHVRFRDRPPLREQEHERREQRVQQPVETHEQHAADVHRPVAPDPVLRDDVQAAEDGGADPGGGD